ncbi:hypothetical protein CCYA_CCYA08G2422 [Cyanidiococcus yangmingshanensis]|nr:hypothetical protein CCYA_CCYA08G2422 [Cyanidiococcus yangmingshanensis]
MFLVDTSGTSVGRKHGHYPPLVTRAKTSRSAAKTEAHHNRYLYRTAATCPWYHISKQLTWWRPSYDLAVRQRRETSRIAMRSSADDHSAPVSGASDQQDQAEYQSVRVTASTPSKAFFFDIMGTLVRDPFFEDMYRHFGFATHADFIAAKHPETWIRFERGEVSATELARLFFRPRQTLSPALARYAKFDPDRFESYLRDSYAFLDEGMESLLAWLASKRPRYTVHAFSNYPRYYRLIEEKLNLSRYLHWTAVSCEIGVRKPAPEAYIEAARRAGVPLSHCVLIDDQQRNVEGARKAGFGAAILFPGTSASLWPQLRALLDDQDAL